MERGEIERMTMNNFIKEVPHLKHHPLSIEREVTLHGEVIIIEGVRYDADYFRTFSHPDTDMLYAVRRDEETVVLTVIQTPEEASEFFEETLGRGDPAPTEDQDGL